MSLAGCRVGLVGVGLIAGSLGLVLRERAAVREVVGFGRSAEPLTRAVERGAIDRFSLNAKEALGDVDIVILGVPLGVVRPVLEQIRPALKPNVVLSDVGSAKQCVVDDVQAVFGHLPAGFVPGHPIAGTEHSGIDAAFPGLFVGRRVILTPTPETNSNAVGLTSALWEAAGAEVVCMPVHTHDRMLAMTSHLPHLLAFGLVDMLAGAPDHNETLRYAAGGFRDFTRIASSDPVMWRDICLGNREALMEALAAYRDDLAQLTALVAAGDGDGIEAVFKRAKQTRDAHLHWFER